MIKTIAPLLAFPLLAVSMQVAFAQTKTYPDGHGGTVTFPQGDVSFADEVVLYDTGTKQPVEEARDPKRALGAPDYDEAADRNYTTLGCGGTLVLRFVDNSLIDIPGPDLYVFEIGPAVEPTALAISEDGENWVRVGQIEGGKAEIDIAPYVDAGAEFHYVKLVDLKSDCGGRWPGADIDAVGAIGSAQNIAVDSAALFDTGKNELKPSASVAIDKAMSAVNLDRVQSITVTGHTDSTGANQDNMILSRKRAQAVADYLLTSTGIAESMLSIEAHGEAKPIASNDTAEGRAKNRRVELSVRSETASHSKDAAAKVEILGIWRSEGGQTTTLYEQDGAVQGDSNEADEARIRGAFTSPTVYEGYWIQKKSKQACDSEKDGSKHWGRLRITFDSPERNALDAQWGRCMDENWSGNWPHQERVL